MDINKITADIESAVDELIASKIKNNVDEE
jgi:hypothetical protein